MRPLPWLREVRLREWAWLALGLVVAAVIALALWAFRSYELGYDSAATSAMAAELHASQINGLEWRTIAEGRVPPGRYKEADELLREISTQLAGAGGVDAATWRAIRGYRNAIHTEFRLLAAGQTAAARRFDQDLVDPAYETLIGKLQQIAAANERAASRASVLALAGDIAVVSGGLLAISVLALRFAGARRALATAEVEQRLLLENERARSALITVVSHDLRTPLTSVIGYLEMILDGDAGPVSSEQRTLLAVAQRSASRLQAIVGDLLFISKVRAGHVDLQLEEVDLERAAAHAIEAQRPQAAEKGIRLAVRAVPAPQIVADPGRVDELLENLLSNALKFTPPGGEVQVAVRPADGHVRLEVSDTGAGISDEDQRHVFEQFFRSPEMSGMPGVGLGLTIVKSIADAHNARISLHSVQGQGTTFGVDFPVGDGRAPAAGLQRLGYARTVTAATGWRCATAPSSRRRAPPAAPPAPRWRPPAPGPAVSRARRRKRRRARRR